jgi:ubiquinone/menaquinone biosynthesis C-methylase UbiE
MSYDEAFASRYDEWSAPMTADIPVYVELARETDGPLLELAVGNGRVAIPVALATGELVIGIDSSPAMLKQARERALRRALTLTCGSATCATSLSMSQPA